MKVLYVEDDALDVDLTLRALKKSDKKIEIDVAWSQQDALKTIKSADFPNYDLVLTDMNLGDGDGIAILSYIRSRSVPIPVIMLTGQGDEESAVAALKAGADNYIVKKSGYLEHLPRLLEDAYLSNQSGTAKRVQKLNVLYVEHNHADVDLTIRHFEKHAHHIKINAIQPGGDSLGLLQDHSTLASYDVLMLDYRLPQENALEILKRIKTSESSKIPVILITGKGDEEIAVQALRIGAFDYITKNQGYLHKLPSAIENAYYNMRLEREHQALQESEQRYRNLFENSHTIMLLIDPENGKILDANPAAVLFYGWSREELKEKSVAQINTLTPDELFKTMHAAASRDNNHFTFRHRLADGSLRDVEVHSGPIEVDGRPVLYSIVYDITQRLKDLQEKERLQKQLIQAQKMESFGQLAGGIAHDFNNILSSIIGFTELALDEVEKGSAIEDDLQEVYAAGKRAKDLVGQILAFARQSDEKAQPVKIAQITTEVLKLIRSTTPSVIEIKQNIDTEAFIMGSAIQIHQIIMNLCTNAIHAMEEKGGVLQVNLSDVPVDDFTEFSGMKLNPGDYVRMTVSDTGTGIPREIIESIFEPYFTTKAPGEGTGMGLAMVYGIVEKYGGKIAVESEPGKGSVFTILLPVVKERELSRIYETSELPKGNEKILFVDDEAAIVKMGKLILERLGYEVTTCTGSVEALNLFHSNPDYFDLLITDMTMPTMTGDQLAKDLMKVKPDLPVILCTGFSKKISKAAALQIGIKAFAHKPIVKEELANTIREVLDDANGKNLNSAR